MEELAGKEDFSTDETGISSVSRALMVKSLKLDKDVKTAHEGLGV